MASTYLSSTPSSAGNRKIFTFSAWVKRSKPTDTNRLIDCSTSGTSQSGLLIGSDDKLNFYTGSGQTDVLTNRLFRDTSAWYHIVLAVDTTQTTASDRVKMYVNGVQETSFSTETYPSQNYDTLFNTTTEHRISKRYDSTQYFNGSMAHVHFIDGTQYQASDFGETDATTGIWKPKTAPSVTYGTNGFFLKFASSGSMGTDSSGNGNNFTVNGNLTQTQDTPSNVFATFNPLTIPASSGLTLSDGNLSLSGSSTDAGAKATLGVSSGKWYWEVKANTASSGSDRHLVATDIVRHITSATDPNSQGIWGI